MAAAWIESDLDTMRRAIFLVLTEEKALAVIWRDRVGSHHTKTGLFTLGVRIAIGTLGRDE